MYSTEVFLRLLDIAEVRFLRKILKSKILLRHFSRSYFASNFVFPTTLLFMYLCFIIMSFPNFNDITVIGCLLSYIEMFISAYANSDYAEHDISLCYVGMLWSLLSFPAILGTRIQNT